VVSRSMTSIVSALSSVVANGHQTVHSVSSTPSKIPYGGFSPVRLQTSCQQRPSLLAQFIRCHSHELRHERSHRSRTFARRHSQLRTQLTHPVALGSASGYAVRQPLRLRWPHPRLWPSASAYGLCPTRSRTPELPQFTPRVCWVRVVSRTPAVSTVAFDCCFTVDAAFVESAPARQPLRQTFRTGLNSVTRLQNLPNATT
jgi:hypothetical protein